MKMKVGLTLLEFSKIVLAVFGCVLPANLIKVDQRSFFCAIFVETG